MMHTRSHLRSHLPTSLHKSSTPRSDRRKICCVQACLVRTAATCTNDAWGIEVYSLYCKYEHPKLETFSSGAAVPIDLLLFSSCTGSTLPEGYTDSWTHTLLPTESVRYPIIFTAGLEKINLTSTTEASAVASTMAPTPTATGSVVGISSGTNTPSATSGTPLARQLGLAFRGSIVLGTRAAILVQLLSILAFMGHPSAIVTTTMEFW